MSILFRKPLPRSAYQRQVWGEFFGDLIHSARQQRDLTIEEAARAARMRAAAWEAIEAGRVPATREQLQALAVGLGVEWSALAGLALFCRGAWER